MRNTHLLGTGFLALILAFTLSACSSGGNPDVALVGPDGSESSSLDSSAPVSAEINNLSANTQYTVQVNNPSGTTVCESNVYSDNEGSIPVSPYCYVRDKDTNRFPNDGRVDALSSKYDDQIDAVFGGGIRSQISGDYEFLVLDSDGNPVFDARTINFTNSAARACASNADGYCARSFLKTSSNVYATIEEGVGVSDGDTVDIYVISDRCSLGYGDNVALADVSGGADMNVTVNFTSGIFTTTSPVWANPASTGIYDVVIDVDQSGTYTEGDIVEIIDPVPQDENNPGGLCGVGFTVQDAYDSNSHVIMQIAMDKNRAYQDVFSRNRGEDVYAQVQSQRRLVHKFGVNKWVVTHQDIWNDGDPLDDVIPVTLDEVQTGCTNQQRRLVAPVHLLEPGCYDIVFDVDGDGVYDKGGDAVDNIDLNGSSTCGFMVVDDDISVSITSILNTGQEEVLNGTSESISSKVTVSGTAEGFTTSAIVKGYTVVGSQQGGIILGSINAEGQFTIEDLPLLAGQNTVKVQITEDLGTSSAKIGSTVGSVNWRPAGLEDIAFSATINWLTLTDMDTHLVKTSGTFAGRSNAGNLTDCHYTNCAQDNDEALDWTTELGSQTTSTDASTGGIARLDLDCIGCQAKTETVWVQATSSVVPEAGNFLLCVYAYSGTDTPSATVSLNGVSQLPSTAPESISSSGSKNTWFVGYASQTTTGGLSWHAVNQVGDTDVCSM